MSDWFRAQVSKSAATLDGLDPVTRKGLSHRTNQNTGAVMTNTQSENLQAETKEYERLLKMLESANRHPSNVPEWLELRILELGEILHPEGVDV